MTGKSLILGSMLVLGLGMPSLAQNCTGAQALQNNCQQNSNEVDAMTGAGSGQLNMMDLLHRAQMGGPIDMENYTVEQRQNIGNAADKFRSQQLERIQPNSQQSTVNNQQTDIPTP